MQIFNKIFFVILFLSLTSCGLHAVYKEREDEDMSYVEDLAAIRMKKERNALHQELKNNLYDLLEVEYKKVEPKYFLTVNISKTITSTFTTTTGSSGRNRVNMDVSYDLKSLETGEIISSGTTTVWDSYEISTNRFGTVTAEDYILTNLTKTAAKNLRNLLINDIIEMRKKKSD